ncbi:hypothetical protein SNE40_017024 [Patella caerulea]|uniref:Uncharacterized protein n=1 Tax=Patella caerulea TaxID=87958 RepID=A0AAN8JB45_PATCE
MTNEEGVNSEVTGVSEAGNENGRPLKVQFYLSGGSLTEENYPEKLMYATETTADCVLAGLTETYNYTIDDVNHFYTPPLTTAIIDPENGCSTDLPDNQPAAIKLSRSERFSLFWHSIIDNQICDYLCILFSGLYAMILVILGLVISVSRTYTSDTNSLPHLLFSLYLYVVSIAFLAFVILCLIRNSPLHQRIRAFISTDSLISNKEDLTNPAVTYDVSPTSNTGSFYLRLAAIGFGIGSMIMIGLQVGQFLEVLSLTGSVDVMIGLSHLLHLFFTFIQLYFIFSYSKLCYQRFKLVARFGLMHLVATNLCVWFSDVVTATLTMVPNDNITITMETNISKYDNDWTPESNNILIDSSLGTINQSLSPYLYPCSIQYSFICTGITYIMWKNIGNQSNSENQDNKADAKVKAKRSRLSIDCTNSSKGLFFGVFLLVVTVIVSIIFIVLQRGNHESRIAAFQTLYISDLVVGAILLIAAILAFWNMRNLQFNSNKTMDLEEVLLLGSLSGIYMFHLFSIIAAYHVTESPSRLLTGASVVIILQATTQTVAIFCGLRMRIRSRDQEYLKPGREATTFLLVSNMALFGVDTVVVQNVETNPIQILFFGNLSWYILIHIAWPFVIFYRIQSSVCLSNVWKRTGDSLTKASSSAASSVGKLSSSEC